MCGIAGFLRGTRWPADAERAVRAMTDAIAYRGPDDVGQWVDQAAGVALGHRRLAVIDLTEAGHQPMASVCGRYVLIYNGEIYNHEDLRRQLPQQTWVGHSDTETLTAAISAWGLEAALARCVGMFALALWDRQARTLSLARDRIGEKPLYWGFNGGIFVFGSELKALRRLPGFAAEIDRQSVEALVRSGYISQPRSIYAGVHKVPAGHIVTIPAEAAREDAASSAPYWSLHDAARAGLSSPFEGSPEEAVDEVERLLDQSVRGQMLSDVALGAFLSGGIDSSLVVAAMQRCSAVPVKTFTIGFAEAAYDEADHARAVADHLGTDHTELRVTADDALAVIPRLGAIYDEPFADMSQIPTVLVSQLARRSVTVALSGDGGDELFQGYSRYPTALNTWHKLSRIPLFARRMIKPFLPRGVLREGFATANFDDFYRFMNTQWKGQRPVTGARPLERIRLPDGLSADQRMAFTDMASYLPDDIMVKVDRAAMAVSLETRAPLLDHRLVEFSWSLRGDVKVRDGIAKWPLKRALYRRVPQTLVDRPKMGFGVPIESWLRTTLRPWAEELLSRDRLAGDGIFDVDVVRQAWQEHLAGTDRHYALWAVLMFQTWKDGQRD